MKCTSDSMLRAALEIDTRGAAERRLVGRHDFADEEVPQLPRQPSRGVGMRGERGDEVDAILHAICCGTCRNRVAAVTIDRERKRLRRRCRADWD